MIIPAVTATPFKNPAEEERATTKATLVVGIIARVSMAANRADIPTRLIVIPKLNVSFNAEENTLKAHSAAPIPEDFYVITSPAEPIKHASEIKMPKNGILNQ